MGDYEKLINESSTLSGLFGSSDFSNVKDATENLEEVMSQGSHFNGMSDVSPEMIESFMRGKVDRINAVNARAEEISAKKQKEMIERYGSAFSEREDGGVKCAPHQPDCKNTEDTEKELSQIKEELNDIKGMMRKMLENQTKTAEPDVKDM